MGNMNTKLTALSSGGGCGCKVSPEILSDILGKIKNVNPPPQLLVGSNTADDGAVYQIDDKRALVSTTDFFTPIVDDPEHFVAIAAPNAISDIYAMGAKPIFALVICGMPLNRLSSDTVVKILEGGSRICSEAGITIAGGHTINISEPIYGLVVNGIVNLSNLKKNSTTSVGNKLILGKPLGIGIYSAALKKGLLSTLQYNLLVDSTTKLNSIGTDFGKLRFVNAMTDITGFGLLGHLDEMARSSNTTIKVNSNKILSYPGINNLIEKGCITGASERNLQALASEVLFADSVSKVDKSLLTDPQTSGGLLVSVESNRANVILDMFKNQDYEASIVGEVIEENPKYRILVVNE